MPSSTNILQNFAGIYAPLQAFVFSVATFLAAILAVVGLLRLRAANRTGDSPARAFATFAASVFLFSIASVMTRASETFAGSSSPLEAMAYSHPSGSATAIFVQVAVGMIVLLGWVAGAAGLYQISEIGGNKSNPGLAAKLLVGGALAVNFVQVAGAITAQLGLGTGWISQFGL